MACNATEGIVRCAEGGKETRKNGRFSRRKYSRNVSKQRTCFGQLLSVSVFCGGPAYWGQATL